MLTDAGPLIALIDRRDQHHRACMAAVNGMPRPLETVLPALVEAMYMLGERSGWRGQEELWQLFQLRELVVAALDDVDLNRACELMRQYRDVPMDFADATLVALAERRNQPEMFTLDRRGFLTYRLRGRRAFVLQP